MCKTTVLDFIHRIGQGFVKLSQTWGHIYPFLSTRGRQCYKWWQFYKKQFKFIKNAIKLGVLLEAGSHIAQ
jgi:hypothetical protein